MPVVPQTAENYTYDGRVNSDLTQQNDIVSKQGCQTVISHGVTAIFNNKCFSGITPHKGQCFRKDICLR